LTDGLKDALVGEVLRHQAHFAKPCGKGGHRQRRGLDYDGRMCHTRHVCPPCLGSRKMFSLTMRHMFARLTSLAQHLMSFSYVTVCLLPSRCASRGGTGGGPFPTFVLKGGNRAILLKEG